MYVAQTLADPWADWTAETDEALVVEAINRSAEVWLSVEAIAAEAGLPVSRVRAVLDSPGAAIITAPPGRHGAQPKYSTREHYRAAAGVLSRYLDAVVSS